MPSPRPWFFRSGPFACSGFTIIQLLISIGIIAVLTVTTFVATQNVRAKARDTKRVSDAQHLAVALQLYKNNTGEYPASLTSGESLAGPDGTVYIAKIPSNPSPRNDGGCPNTEYRYDSDGASYYWRFCLGNDSNQLQGGINVCYNGDCGLGSDFPVVDAEGNTYSAVAIGTQLWMAENLQTKLKPNGTCINGGGPPPCPGGSTGSGYSCYADTETNCATDGALYTWSAAMNGSTAAGAPGICPMGWHIPTDAEQHTLEAFLTDPGQTCDPSRNGWDCATAGTRLQTGGASGFNALLAGYRHTNGFSFGNFGVATYFWSSSESGSAAWLRRLNADTATVNLNADFKAYSFSLRCLKN